ncbi:hypothetical protein ACH0BF_20460 [Pseudobacillus sp. 179-B 2D1 NHS]|uniref:hypothetical protein n=1 Tax=Pseudobacillus sp. 179-B 2D1 NHS TaxID=3374292 RepID=UPI00387A27A0
MSVANFTAIIGANIRQFTNRIREAQQQAQRFQLTDITAQITARINEFRARMAQARAQLNQFARSEAVAEIRARITDFTAGLLRARALAQQFARDEIVARITVNTQRFMERITAARTAASAFLRDRIEAILDVDTSRFAARIAAARAAASAFIRDRITAIINVNTGEFMAQLAAARLAVSSFIRDRIVARIRVNTSEFMTRLAAARAAANAFIYTRIVMPINANIARFTAGLANARAQASAFIRDRIVANIRANTSLFMTQLSAARAAASAFIRNRIVANIRANTTQFMSRLAAARAAASAFVRNRITAIVDATTSRFSAALARVRAAMAAINGRNIIIEIEARIERFQQTIGRIASNIRAFGELMSNTLRGAFISLSSTAAPILANLGGLIGSLGPMIGTVAGSAFALVTAFASAGAAAVAFGAIAIPTIKKLFDENAKLNAVQKEAKASFTAFGNTWKGIVKDLEKPVLQAFKTGMQAANQMLKMSQPLFASATKAMNNLMTSLKQSLGTPPVQAFFDYLNKSAGPMLEVTGKAVGNLFQGLMSMMTAFGPLAMNTANGFLQMSRNFATWAAGLSKSEKFQSFVNYINENMPKIRAIFRDALAGTVYFFSAFGSLSSGMMTRLKDMMAGFKEWSANLGQNKGFQNFINYVRSTAPTVISLIGNITKFLVNLGIGLAPLGAKLLSLVNGFLAFTNSMMQAHPVLGQIFSWITLIGGALIAIVPNIIAFSTLFGGLGGVLGRLGTRIITFISGGLARLLPAFTNVTTVMGLLRAAFMTLTGPVGIAIAAILGIVAVLKAVYNSNETFRNQVQTAWEAIKSAITTAVTAIGSFVTSIWGSITAFWTANQDTIMGAVQTVWSAIQTTIVSVMTAIMSAVSFMWPAIQATITSVWTVIQVTITSALNVVLGLVKIFAALLKGDWQGAWEGVKQVVSSAIQMILNQLKLGFMLFLAPITTFGGAAKSAISSAWNAIKNVFSNVLNTIKNIVKAAFDAINNTVKSVMETIKSIIQTVWNAIKSTITSVLNGIKSTVTSIWNAIKSTVTSVMNAIKSAITSAWNAIKSAVTSSLNAIKSVVTSSWNAIKSAVTSAMNGIKSVVTSAWSAISSTVSSRVSAIYSVVVSKFNALKSAVASAMTGVKTAIVNGWNAAKSFLSSINLSGIGRNIIQGLVNGMNSMMGAVQSKIQSIANTIKNGIKSALSIHSPSRVMRDEVGVWITKGIAVGMEAAINSVVAATNKVAKAAMPDFKSGMQVNINMINQFNKYLINVNNQTAKELAKIKQKSSTDIKNIETKAQKDIAAIEKGAREKKRKLTASEVRRIEKIHEDSAKKIADIQSKNSTQIKKLEANVMKDKLTAIEDFISNKRKLETISYADEIKIWELAVQKFKKGTEEKRLAELQLRDAKLNYNKELFEKEKSYIENKKKLNQMSLVQELAAWEQVSKRYAAGTAERIEAEQKVMEIKQDIHEKLKSLSDEYLEKMQEVNQKLIDDEKRLREEYQKSVDDRAKALVNFAGLFDELSEKEAVAGETLIDNLKSQVSAMADWAADMQTLAAKGVDKGLIEELQSMGPKAAAEVQALVAMSDVQLAEFQGLWKEKSRIAKEQAVAEMEGLRLDTEKQIDELRANANSKLLDLKNEFVSKVSQLRTGATNEFNAMAASLPEIGKNAIQGLINGMRTMKGALLSATQDLADSVKASLQSAFDIHSPSRWMRDIIGKNLVSGLIVGINTMEHKATVTTAKMAEWFKPQLSDVSISRSSLDVGLQMDELKRQIDQKLDVDLWIHQKEGRSAAGFKQEVHLHSPTALSPSENARALKKVGQQQALEWGV